MAMIFHHNTNQKANHVITFFYCLISLIFFVLKYFTVSFYEYMHLNLQYFNLRYIYSKRFYLIYAIIIVNKKEIEIFKYLHHWYIIYTCRYISFLDYIYIL